MFTGMTKHIFLASLLGFAAAATGQTMAGTWDATLQINGVATPFRLEIAGTDAKLTGTLFNGAEKYSSTSGSFANGALTLGWDYYASTLKATLKDGVLEGQYAGTRRMTGPFPFRAQHAAKVEAAKSSAPPIAGVWWIPTNSGKGEKAWRFVVQQSGNDLTVAILRVDGDTGSIVGGWRGDKFVVSKFDGARAFLMEIKPSKEGTLDILQDGKTKYTAYRPEMAKAMKLPEPTDPTAHTSVKDPKEPFRFQFPDLTGKMVSNTDARFRNKVVVIEITGSWCPNCHDEAPFLEEMYRTYKDRGLEVVSLSFEEAEQLKDPTRLKAFVKQYKLEFPVLLGGDTETAAEHLPQLVNWNTWPATLFVDRKGLVRSTHAGFPSTGSGDLFVAAKEEFKVQVGRLLAEK